MIIRPGDEPLTCACRCGTPVKHYALSTIAARNGRTRPYARGHSIRYRQKRILRLPDRFWAKVSVDLETGCWNWTASKCKEGYRAGYGIFNVGGRASSPYVLTYTALVGPVPAGLELDHLCRNRGCCNPEHLEPVTHAENMARSIRAMQTHCIRGHEFTPANTYRTTNGTRGCRRCHADQELNRPGRKEAARERYVRNMQDPAWRARRAAYGQARKLKARAGDAP